MGWIGYSLAIGTFMEKLSNDFVKLQPGEVVFYDAVLSAMLLAGSTNYDGSSPFPFVSEQEVQSVLIGRNGQPQMNLSQILDGLERRRILKSRGLATAKTYGVA